MKARPLFSALRTILLLSVMVLASCGGDGDGGHISAPPITTLTVGAPVTDTVVFQGFNFYSTPVIPGALYKVSITGLTDDADLQVFGNDSTFSLLAQCAIDNTIMESLTPPFLSEDCVINAPGNTLFFGVDGTFLTASSAAVYTIDVELLTKTNLTSSIPLPDFTTDTKAAVYVVSNTTATDYTVSITGLDDDADLYVFGNNGDFTSPVVCSPPDNTLFSGTTPEDCTLTSSGGALYFIVDGLFSTTSTVNFTALVTRAPAIAVPADEGSIGTPITLVADTPDIGQVGFSGTSFYVATGLTPSQRYTVSVTGMTGDVDLNVYDNDNLFSTTANAKCLIDNTAIFNPPTTAEDCTLQVTGSTLYFSVTAFTQSGGVAFINLVEPGP